MFGHIKIDFVRYLKLQLHNAIYRLQFYSNSLIHILSLSNSHNNAASIQKNRDDKSHSVIVALFESASRVNWDELTVSEMVQNVESVGERFPCTSTDSRGYSVNKPIDLLNEGLSYDLVFVNLK